MKFRNGALVFGRLHGIELSIDWSWLILIYLRTRGGGFDQYQNPGWYVVEFAAFMVTILLHDIAQIIACRFVGGRVTQLQLSFLSRGIDLMPPQRPTPVLLTYLAGSVMWCFCFTVSFATWYAAYKGWFVCPNDLYNFLFMQMFVAGFLMVYNALPAYPNDGGQTLRAVLWYMMGPAWSLRIAAGVGLLAVVGLIIWAIKIESYWIGFMALLMAFSCYRGFKMAGTLAQIQKLVRRGDYRCPHCGANPPDVTRNIHCRNGHTYDLFASLGVCPICGDANKEIVCIDCQMPSPPRTWAGPVGAFPVAPPIQQTPPPPRPIVDAQPADEPKQPPQQ